MTDSKDVNKWDSPSQADRFGREPFVETILKTIKSSKEGFNLGISARWGEGKSSILSQLEPKLKDLNYKVLKFEPWKYTQDQISIKRKFIIDIYSQLGKEYDDTELYSSVERNRDLDSDEYQEWFMGRLGLFVRFAGITAIVLLGILLFVQWFFGKDLNLTQILLSNLFIPFLAGMVPLISKITEITVKQTTPKVESAEQFEKRFNSIIEEIMCGENPPEKIIIFVDDLDRCSHAEVEQILTALFTFFNSKHCTYVITADHTVIRRYISHFLQLDEEVDDNGGVDIKRTNELRQKEATEYLKKIFQINFILPKIPSDLLEAWINELLDANPVIDFKNQYSRTYLINMILTNFQGNPRKIKHFIRTLAFQLEAVSEKIKHLDGQQGDEGKNLTKVQRSPELLAKILIIQDRFPDFYEKITNEPKILQRLEEGEITEDKDIQLLIAQEPKFFNSVTREAAYRTIDPYYFLYFSGATGYAETKAVDPAEIKSLARSADLEGLTKIISGLTDAPRNEQVEHIKKEYDAPQIQPPEKLNVVRSLLYAISLIEEPTLRAEKLKDALSDMKYAEQFTSLQSVDFEKFISLLDEGLVKKLLLEPPFSDFNVQIQLLNAFISKQAEVKDPVINGLFFDSIATGINRNDGNSPAYIKIIRGLTPNNFTSSDKIQQSLVETYEKAGDPLKDIILGLLIDFREKLQPGWKTLFNEIVSNTIENKPIGEALSMMGHIPDRINNSNFDLDLIVSSSIKRIEHISDRGELEQWVNILFHPNIRKEFGPKNTDTIIMSLTEILNDDDSDKRLYIRGQIPQLVGYADGKLAVIRKITESIAASSLSEGSSTLAAIQGLSDFWNDNPSLKKEFAKLLKSTKASTSEVKDLMVKSSNELVPPMLKKIKDDVA